MTRHLLWDWETIGWYAKCFARFSVQMTLNQKMATGQNGEAGYLEAGNQVVVSQGSSQRWIVSKMHIGRKD